MQETDMKEKLQKIIEAYDELQAKMGDPAVLADQKEYNRLGQGIRLPRSARQEGGRVRRRHGRLGGG